MYQRKYDLEEPPKLEDPDEEAINSFTHLYTPERYKELEERFHKYGIKPEWLVVHRVINHRTMRDGRTLYLIKWRELTYDQASWEEDNDEIDGLKPAVEYYTVRFVEFIKVFEVHWKLGVSVCFQFY